MSASEVTQISRLRWLCRRGMKELDVVMSAYLDNHYASASAEEQSLFRDLLQMPDPDLYNLLLGRTEAEDPQVAHLIKRLRR